MKPIQLFIMIVSLSSVKYDSADKRLCIDVRMSSECVLLSVHSNFNFKSGDGIFRIDSHRSSTIGNRSSHSITSAVSSQHLVSAKHRHSIKQVSRKEAHNGKLTSQSWCPLPYPQHASCLPTYQSHLPSLLQAERTVSHLFLSNQMIVVKSQDVDSWRI